MSPVRRCWPGHDQSATSCALCCRRRLLLLVDWVPLCLCSARASTSNACIASLRAPWRHSLNASGTINGFLTLRECEQPCRIVPNAQKISNLPRRYCFRVPPLCISDSRTAAGHRHLPGTYKMDPARARSRSQFGGFPGWLYRMSQRRMFRPVERTPMKRRD